MSEIFAYNADFEARNENSDKKFKNRAPGKWMGVFNLLNVLITLKYWTTLG